MPMKACAIGPGHVSLFTGVCLAVMSHSVLCIDHKTAKVKLMMHTPILIDGRNDLELKGLAQAGFQYVGIGRPTPATPLFESSPQLQTAVAV